MSRQPRAGEPGRPFTIKVTDAERAVWTEAAGDRPLSDWAREVLNLVSGPLRRRAKNAKMTPLEWIQHSVKHNATPVDQTPSAQRRRTAEALGED